jgi:hypothetical protein
MLIKLREKWDESIVVYAAEKEKTNGNDTKVLILISLIILSDLSTIQFRFSFKGHKSLEYYCLEINLASISICYNCFCDDSNDIFVAEPWEIIRKEIFPRNSENVVEAFDSEQTNRQTNSITQGQNIYKAVPSLARTPEQITFVCFLCLTGIQ